MIGVAAHITAAAAGGERYDAALSSTERKSASNGIWMCAIHGKWIDDNASVATADKLRSWKRDHEAEISTWVEHGYVERMDEHVEIAVIGNLAENIAQGPRGHEVSVVAISEQRLGDVACAPHAY